MTGGVNPESRGRRSGPSEVDVLPLLTRHAIQVLAQAGHAQEDIARRTGASVRTVRRVSQEVAVTHVDDTAERRARGVGRPRVAEPYRAFVRALLADEPTLPTLEVLRRARLDGYAGAKSAFYALVASERPRQVKVECRFEAVAGEFSQHDFGQVDVRFVDGSVRRVHFFASRLKYSRWSAVSIVPDQGAESLVRVLLDHFVSFGGVPLCAVFDRPKTVALAWKKDGAVTTWNPVFAGAAMDIGFTADVCWPYQPQQKGAVEKLVGWVKSSFFKVRRFIDMDDLRRQLAEWLAETNTTRPSRATGVPPAARIEEERARLRAPRVGPDALAIRVPVHVGPTAEVVYEARPALLPPEAAGLPGTIHVFRDRVRIVAGRHERTHVRIRGAGALIGTRDDRAARLAAISGTRGRRYQRRQELMALGDVAVQFISELVYRQPAGWYREVDQIHELFLDVGGEPLRLAMRASLGANVVSAEQVARFLARPSPAQVPFPEAK